jgi:hypothetical protein
VRLGRHVDVAGRADRHVRACRRVRCR